MPTFLQESDVQLLQRIAEDGTGYMSARMFAELAMISHKFGAGSLSGDYHSIRMKLVDGKWYGISEDELKLYAMELLRVGGAR